MKCDRCGRDVVFHQRYSGLRLCGEHLSLSLESRAKRMIRARGWIQQGDRIAVGLSGGLCSSSLLRFLSVHFGMRRDLTLVAITVDEGSRDMARARGIAEGLGIEWEGAGTRDLCGDRPGEPPTGGGNLPSPSSRARDRALVALAGQVGATRLALGTSLDDEADSVFLHVIRGEAARLLGPGEGDGGISIIRPFSRVPEEEIGLYARLNGIDFIPAGKRGSPGSVGSEAAGMLREYTRRHPSALYSLVSIGEGLAGPARSGRRTPGCGPAPASSAPPGVLRPGDGP